MVNATHEVNLLQSDLDAYQVTCDIEHICRQLKLVVSRDMMEMISKNSWNEKSGMMSFYIDMTGPEDLATSQFDPNWRWGAPLALPNKPYILEDETSDFDVDKDGT